MTDYSQLANQRKEQQRTLEAVATGNASKPKRRKSDTMTQVCVSISYQDKELLQDYCKRHGATIAGLLRVWIQEHCTEE